EGMHDWLTWIERGARAARERRLDQADALKRAAQLNALERMAQAAAPQQHPDPVDALQRRIAELEAQLASLKLP
ncbi:MAG TPA: hypothetical protein VF308_08635, partial [Caldimonas sp.]